jgi:homospermidine synthase
MRRNCRPNGHGFDHGPGYAIWIDRPGADTRVRSWCPDVGPQFGFVVTHNEALSIPDYYTVGEGAGPVPPDLPLCLSPLQRRDPVLHEVNGAGNCPSASIS